jgi:serine/threonine-protein kinase HipA
MDKTIFVYANWQGTAEPILMGKLHSQITRGEEVFSFEYEKNWIKLPFANQIDPDLQLYTGRQYLNDSKKINFGIFLDSSPDRWGRLLMKRREAIIANQENLAISKMYETDYLLGVFDAYRMGGLRFKENENGPFLNNNEEFVAPPWTRIRELEEMSLKLEDESNANNQEILKWIKMLLSPGASLGGARPKASVIDTNSNLWIAKFPSKQDLTDIGCWEMIINKLANMCGINIAEGQIIKLSSPHHTYLTKRFDRTIGKTRIHFASAMTLLGYTDGTDFHDGASYLEIAEFIIKNGAKVNSDLEELWKRIVFSICVSNTDDHLRNHGFLLTEGGWVLSPAYDINPNEDGHGLSLNISENSNELNLELAIDVHEYFRLNTQQAKEIINTTKEAVSKWRMIASEYQIPKSEQDLKANAFQNF